MTKQKLEAIFKNSCRGNSELYCRKIQQNTLSHYSTPADFLVHTKYGATIYVECKECKLNSKGYGVFGFSRLTQEADLYSLHAFSNSIHSFVLVSFQGKKMKDSHYFLVPIIAYRHFTQLVEKKSANLKDFLESLGKCEMKKLKGSLLDVSGLGNLK